MTNTTLREHIDLGKKHIADTVSAHLVSQGKPARVVVGDKGVCNVLRTANGDMCAIGVLLADSEYKRRYDYEQLTAYQLICDLGIKVDKSTQDLLSSLQSVHDNPLAWWDIKSHLRDVYEEYDIPVESSCVEQ